METVETTPSEPVNDQPLLSSILSPLFGKKKPTTDRVTALLHSKKNSEVAKQFIHQTQDVHPHELLYEDNSTPAGSTSAEVKEEGLL